MKPRKGKAAPTLGAVVLVVALALFSHAVPAETAVHLVQPGENLTTIARAYGTSVETLVALNDLTDPNRLKVGQRLIVAGSPSVHVVRRGESLWEIARAYGVAPAELAAWNGVSDPDRIYPGQELVVSPVAIHHRVRRGETVSEIASRYGVTVASLVQVNQIRDPNQIRAGATLLIPPTGGGAAEALAAAASSPARNRFGRWPIQGTITSGFGPRGGRNHNGIDIGAAHGAPVRAVAAGVVTYADWAGSYGLLIKIDHGNGVETRYAHNSQNLVEPGQRVAAGDVIARVGSTGRSTGPHLHFEVVVNGEAVDPRGWLP